MSQNWNVWYLDASRCLKPGRHQAPKILLVQISDTCCTWCILWTIVVTLWKLCLVAADDICTRGNKIWNRLYRSEQCRTAINARRRDSSIQSQITNRCFDSLSWWHFQIKFYWLEILAKFLDKKIKPFHIKYLFNAWCTIEVCFAMPQEKGYYPPIITSL